jgi:hypothetical protein
MEAGPAGTIACVATKIPKMSVATDTSSVARPLPLQATGVIYPSNGQAAGTQSAMALMAALASRDRSTAGSAPAIADIGSHA